MKRYGKTESFEGEPFPSDVFLVFGNRVLAMVVAAAIVMLPIRKEPPGGWAPQAPWLSFAPCSLSNVFSSFAQYHSLDYISFPLQARLGSSSGFYFYFKDHLTFAFFRFEKKIEIYVLPCFP